MLLNVEVISLYVIDLSIFLLSFYAIFISYKIFRSWDFSSTTSFQYDLEKKAYLVSVIIFFIIAVKIAVLPYFVFVVDKLSTIMPGAMCAAGVVNANEYGNYLLLLKIFNIFLAGFWLVLNRLDLLSKELPFMKKKIFLYFVLFVTLVLEVIITSLYFSNLSFETPVSCCSAIFTSTSSSDTLQIDTKYLLILFYLIFCLSVFSNKFNYFIINIISSIIFLLLSINSIIDFFSPYVYQLPTHKCPFCLFQSEYFYIGYVFFSTLFLGVFLSIYYSVLNIFFKVENKNIQNYSLIFMILFFIIVNFYPISYYLTNKVWL
jgi:hypothetical protein